MALQNRQDFETAKLHGVNEAADPSKLDIGWFTFLQNWIPAQRLKIKKKRGVDDVPTGDFFTPNPCVVPVVCTDATLRGQQIITISQAFTQQSGNRRTSWSYINDGEVYTLIGDAGCGSGNMPITATCVSINHYTIDDGGLPAASTHPPTEDAAVPFINTRLGSSDQPAWAATTNAVAGIRIYYDLGATFVDYTTPSINFGGHAVDAWAVKENSVWAYIPCCLDGGPPNVEFAVFDRTTGVKINDFTPFGSENVAVANVQLTDNYAYCVGTGAGSVIKIYKIDRSTGVIVSSLIVTDLAVQYIAIVDDTLMYLLCSGNPCRIYYLANMTDLTYIGYTQDIPVNPFGLGNAIFNNGKIYFGSNGFAGLGVDIAKIEISCPDIGILVASVTTDASVVAGNAINVAWADILVPSATDTILIKPEPAAGVLGLVGSTIASFTNSSLSASGTTSITIPGGTTPGNYVAMYAALGSIWAATSPVFTVT